MGGRDQFQDFCTGFREELDSLARALPDSTPRPAFIWLEANACSGDSISMLNTVQPNLGQLLCKMVSVIYWSALMPDQGTAAVDNLMATAASGDFILAVEGAIAVGGRGRFAVPFRIDGYNFTSLELIRWLAPKARYIIAVGTCASFGGPSAARPNPSDSRGVWEVVSEPVINVPGCPVNPDWFTGTLYHLIRFGPPELDRYRRPTLFYGETIHAHCQRRSYFDNGIFAKKLGDPECMYNLGCMGPVTGSDCPYRLWNNHLNWPVKASTPCIGCTKSGFPDRSTPFLTPFPEKLPRAGRGAGERSSRCPRSRSVR
ncbi:MAG TPA: hydrogenase small subunit [Bacillota bacterium]